MKPLAALQAETKIQDLTYSGFAKRIDVTATLRKIRYASLIVSALAFPDSIEADVPSFFSSAVADCSPSEQFRRED